MRHAARHAHATRRVNSRVKSHPQVAARALGFTLIELLVAISIMSLLAILSWRGIDGMARTQAATKERADQIATLQTALAQWNTDLDMLLETGITSAIDYDGRVLRITRRSSDAQESSLRVVGWAKKSIDGQARWLRWQSAPLRNRGELQAAWLQAQQWAGVGRLLVSSQNAAQGAELSILPVDEVQIFYFRNDAWTNPLSADAQTAVAGAAVKTAGNNLAAVPDGLRLRLTLAAGQPLAGALTRDWARPTLGGGKS